MFILNQVVVVGLKLWLHMNSLASEQIWMSIILLGQQRNQITEDLIWSIFIYLFKVPIYIKISIDSGDGMVSNKYETIR